MVVGDEHIDDMLLCLLEDGGKKSSEWSVLMVRKERGIMVNEDVFVHCLESTGQEHSDPHHELSTNCDHE